MARFRKTAELKAEAIFSIEPLKVARVSGAKHGALDAPGHAQR